MSTKAEKLIKNIEQHLAGKIRNCMIVKDEVTIEVTPNQLLSVCTILRDHNEFAFSQMMDLCGVDYLQYGISHWETMETTHTGFSRGVVSGAETPAHVNWQKPRFAVVIHLLSLKHNHRIRIKVFVEAELPVVPSITAIWDVANWFEREAFDLYGILFEGHPDLRRILTDYGFIGYPFRKDFPLIGTVEPRYDAALKRVIYEPVSIDQRTLVPKVIRQDNRYIKSEEQKSSG